MVGGGWGWRFCKATASLLQGAAWSRHRGRAEQSCSHIPKRRWARSWCAGHGLGGSSLQSCLIDWAWATSFGPGIWTAACPRRCCKPLRSEEHTSELQSPDHLVCRLLLEKKNAKETRRGN